MWRSEKTWKPPESVRIGPSQPMNACSPPSSAITSVARPEVQVVRVAEDDRARRARAPRPGEALLTVAFVPTGMNAGVGTSPCAVRSTPARAAPSVAVSTKRSQDQHRIAEGVEAVALVDREPVELARLLDAGERHHEREQRRARQVEVRQQRVDAPELEARA